MQVRWRALSSGNPIRCYCSCLRSSPYPDPFESEPLVPAIRPSLSPDRVLSVFSALHIPDFRYNSLILLRLMLGLWYFIMVKPSALAQLAQADTEGRTRFGLRDASATTTVSSAHSYETFSCIEGSYRLRLGHSLFPRGHATCHLQADARATH
jgi:hypothetical protein